MYANCVDSRMEIEQAKIGTAVPAVRDISDLETRRIYQVIPFVNEEGGRRTAAADAPLPDKALGEMPWWI